MVNEFMVYVDRLISSACLNESLLVNGHCREGGEEKGENVGKKANGEGSEGGAGGCCSKKKGVLLECRICQEEDEEEELEAPCACNGTLKFAHRKCIQKWCNKKGDITCEICNQVYAPNYSIPPPRATDGLTIDIRSWGPRIDLHDPHFLALAAAEHRFLQGEYDDYAGSSMGIIGCCRSLALLFMVLLLIRHALTITKDSGLLQESLTVFNLSFLQFVGLLLPCYVIFRALYVLQTRRRRQQ